MKKIIVGLLVVVVLAAAGVYSVKNQFPSPPDDDPEFQASEEDFAFDFTSDKPFSEYIKAATGYVSRNRVFQTDDHETELQQVIPFEISPKKSCKKEDTKGVLFIHGLGDTPYIYRALAEKMTGECLLMRSILLPGSGTRSGDYLNIQASEWIEAIDYAMRGLENESKEVHMFGFSLGGALSLHLHQKYEKVASLVLLSPSLDGRDERTSLASLLQHIVSWASYTDPSKEESPIVWYRSFTMNVVAQVYGISRSTKRILAENPSNVPMLIYLSDFDNIVEARVTIDHLLDGNISKKSKFYWYTPVFEGAQPPSFNDDRVEVINTFMPDEMIVTFSHVAFIQPSGNDYFGKNESELCSLRAEGCSQWLGELAFDELLPERFRPIRRLTFNTEFNKMAKKMSDFIDENSLKD